MAHASPTPLIPISGTFSAIPIRLETFLADLRRKFPAAYIGMNLDATGPTNDLTYNTDPLKYLPVEVPIPSDEAGHHVTFFPRNTSTLIDIRIDRIPTDRIFARR